MPATLEQRKSNSSSSSSSSSPDSAGQRSSPSSFQYPDKASLERQIKDEEEDYDANDDLDANSKPKARSRMGCFTCRKRKKRCDERKPVCKACVRLKLECKYPEPGQEHKNKKRKSSYDGSPDECNNNASPSVTIKSKPKKNANKDRPPAKKTKHSYAELNTAFNIDRATSLSTSAGGDSSTQSGTVTAMATPNFSFAEFDSSCMGSFGRANTPPLLKSGYSPSPSSIHNIIGPDALSSFPSSATPKSSGLVSENYVGLPINTTNDQPSPPVYGPHDSGPHTAVTTKSPSPMPTFSSSAVFARGLHSLMASPRPEQSPRIREVDDDGNYSESGEILQKSPLSFFDTNMEGFHFNSPPSFFEATQDMFAVDGLGREFSTFPMLSTPTPWYATHLDSFGIEMFNYYRTSLADMICVSGGGFNSFVDVFIPMAEQDPAVLYAMVAYGSFHNNMGKQENAGMKYLNKALEIVRQDLPKGNLTTLACILLLVTAEICRGDMIHWDKHLEAAAAVIKMNGGLKNFFGDRTKRWLASNFFYHEILGASRHSRKTHFKAIEYDQLMRNDIGVHSLIGCCKSIFHLMAQLSDLAVEAQGIYEKFMRKDDASGLHQSVEIRDLLKRARSLEDQIDQCKPDPVDIVSLSPQDQEEQLTLFDTFQLTAKLQLQQSVLRQNAASLNMQVLASELVESLDVVLNTKVEGLLVLPIFMASIMAVLPSARMAMLDRFEAFYKRNLARNILRARNLAEQVWDLDCNGTKYVNWPLLIQSQGMDICFA